MHDRDPVGDADYFFHVARDHQDRHTGIRKLTHQTVDFAFCADVDAAGGLVEDQHLRVHCQPFGEHDLLLVAARKRAGARRDRWRLDGELPALRFGHGIFSLWRNHGAACKGREVG